MNEIIINETNIKIREWNKERVVTFTDIDMVHAKAEGTAKRTFYKYKKYFTANHDYFVVKPDDFLKYATCTLGIEASEIPNRGVTFITESGYLKITKPISGEKAWEVQCQLVNTYFKFKDTMTAVEPVNDGLILPNAQFVDAMDTLTTCAAVFQSMMGYSTINYKQSQELLLTARKRINVLLGGAHSQEYKRWARVYFKNLWLDFCQTFDCGSYRDLNPLYMDGDVAKQWIKNWAYSGN